MHLINAFPISSTKNSFETSKTKEDALPPYSIEIPSNPTQTAEKDYIQDTVNQILRCYKILTSAECLSPSNLINETFGKLVEVAIQVPKEDVAEKILMNEDIARILPDLQRLCSMGEYELEKEWAILISNSKTEKEENFPYYENYIDLTRLEINAIRSALPNNSLFPNKIAFIGSGPLPLSSICLLRHLQSQSPHIQNIDISPTAISLSSTLTQTLSISPKNISFNCQDASSPALELKSFDLVILAALVGSNGVEKERVLMNVVGGMREGALLVVRSAFSLRRLLYPEVGLGIRGFRVGLEVRSMGEVVNSVVVGRVGGV